MRSRSTACETDSTGAKTTGEFCQPDRSLIMLQRWGKTIKSQIPMVDLADLAQEVDPENQVKRQFAAEYSQSSYNAMLKQEVAIGDYALNGKLDNFTRK